MIAGMILGDWKLILEVCCLGTQAGVKLPASRPSQLRNKSTDGPTHATLKTGKPIYGQQQQKPTAEKGRAIKGQIYGKRIM